MQTTLEREREKEGRREEETEVGRKGGKEEGKKERQRNRGRGRKRGHLAHHFLKFKAHMSYLSSLQFGRLVMPNSLQPHGLQQARPPCPSPIPRLYSNLCPLSDAIQPSHPLSSPSPPAFNLSQHEGLFR